MLNRFTRVTLAAAALGIAPLSVAMADANITNSCSSGALIICVNYSLTNTGGNNYSLTYSIANASGGAFITAVGLENAGAGTFTGITTPAGWTFTSGATGNCSDLSNFAGLQFCDATNGNSGVTSVTFTFSFTGSESALEAADVASHVQGIPLAGGGTCSAKPLTDVSTTTNQQGVHTTATTTSDATCGFPSTTSTPEPASLLLVGSGLAGLGGLITRRRKAA
jgi:hypothetical protein